MTRRIEERRAAKVPCQYMVVLTPYGRGEVTHYGPFASDVTAYVWASNRWPVPSDAISPWQVIPLLSTEIR